MPALSTEVIVRNEGISPENPVNTRIRIRKDLAVRARFLFLSDANDTQPQWPK
jgi:hypothetical protein